MKSDTVPRSARYRNEAVFRSAERLIASRPSRPPRKRASPWLLFGLGIACGLSVVLWWPRVREFSPVISRGPDPVAAPTGQSPSGRRVSTVPGLNPVPARTNPAPSTPVAATLVDPSLDRAARPAASPVRPGASPAKSAAPSAPLVSQTVSRSPLRLEGELHNPAGARVNRVRFLLHLVPDTAVAAGIVIFPDQDGNPVREEPMFRDPKTQRVALHASTLFGTWNLTTILLHSDSKAPGYEFTLQFPTTSTGEFTGTWTDGRGASGPLALQIPRPTLLSGRTNPR